MRKIAVIGGGWYGCHIALELARKGYAVTLFEKNSKLFSEISGDFGIRLHVGPHYPRSPATRQSCRTGFTAFATEYPELIVSHASSVYAVGSLDANGRPSKITANKFVDVCQENSLTEVITDKTEMGRKGLNGDNLEVVVELYEPSIRVGRELHDYFYKKLVAAGVSVVCNYKITSVQKIDSDCIEVSGYKTKQNRTNRPRPAQFEQVVSATSFQSLLPSKRLRLPFQVFYQPCLGLIYKDNSPTSKKPFSMIMMDGFFPCMMPIVPYNSQPDADPHYILTHGKWTIMASYTSVDEARERLAQVDDAFIQERVQPHCEDEISRFLPSFKDRFEYVGWKGAVLAKPKSEGEFRGAIVFKDEQGITHIIPGKVTHTIAAGNEVKSLIEGKHVIEDKVNGFSRVKDGTLDRALSEFGRAIGERNTCDLQTFRTSNADDDHGSAAGSTAADKVALLTTDTTHNQQTPRNTIGITELLLMVMLTLFAVNEHRGNPVQIVRPILGLLAVVLAFMEANKMSKSGLSKAFPMLWQHNADKNSLPSTATPPRRSNRFAY